METFLEDKFSELDELGGIPIIKDNCEDLFENWCSSLDVSDMIEYADEYAEQIEKEMLDLLDVKVSEIKQKYV